MALKICATLNVPVPAGKAIKIEGGIANDPAVTGARQTKPTGRTAPPAVVNTVPPLISMSFNAPEVESTQYAAAGVTPSVAA
jgi:hypothetical protein